jgi:collagenase-like PrtC family protease
MIAGAWIYIEPTSTFDRYRATIKHEGDVVYIGQLHRTPARARAQALAWLNAQEA